MRRSRLSEQQILRILKQGEAGRNVSHVSRANGISVQTFSFGARQLADGAAPRPAGGAGRHDLLEPGCSGAGVGAAETRSVSDT